MSGLPSKYGECPDCGEQLDNLGLCDECDADADPTPAPRRPAPVQMPRTTSNGKTPLRVENLNLLLDGGQLLKDIAARGGLNASWVSTCKTKCRINDEMARKLERGAGVYEGWLDEAHPRGVEIPVPKAEEPPAPAVPANASSGVQPYQIEAGVPMPGRPESRYRFSEMNVGDSFWMPVEAGEDPSQVRNRARKAWGQFIRQNGYEWRFRTAQVVEDGQHRIRVWRSS